MGSTLLSSLVARLSPQLLHLHQPILPPNRPPQHLLAPPKHPPTHLLLLLRLYHLPPPQQTLRQLQMMVVSVPSTQRQLLVACTALPAQSPLPRRLPPLQHPPQHRLI